ncbi:DUF2254 domain-containing protein [Haematobacter genomosp. 1]|nr:DUF2254 domain-containing protein [Haematobacter genomosp. 1]
MIDWRLFFARLARRIWFRAAAFSILAVMLAIAAKYLGPFLPDELNADLGQDSVGNILQILASSMLAVTTFSLTAVVSAYSSATNLATPRSTQLLIEDQTAQNALSTFLGSFLFSLVGIIALSTGFYDEKGRIILFIGTIGVVILIAVTLLGWIAHITSFGRMSDVIDRVETAATRVARKHAYNPCLGGVPAVPVPEAAKPIFVDQTGSIVRVNTARLIEVAEEHDLTLHLPVIAGTYIHPRRPVLFAEGKLDDAAVKSLRRSFTVERHRSFGDDPRLGFIALSEIASRALSSAVNDPGTVIETINAIQRVFVVLLQTERTDEKGSERLHVACPWVKDFVEDAFRPILRDAAELEVSVRLQKALAALAALSDMEEAAVFRRAADEAAIRARDGLHYPADLTAFEAGRREAWELPVQYGGVSAR